MREPKFKVHDVVKITNDSGFVVSRSRFSVTAVYLKGDYVFYGLDGTSLIVSEEYLELSERSDSSKRLDIDKVIDEMISGLTYRLNENSDTELYFDSETNKFMVEYGDGRATDDIMGYWDSVCNWVLIEPKRKNVWRKIIDHSLKEETIESLKAGATYYVDFEELPHKDFGEISYFVFYDDGLDKIMVERMRKGRTNNIEEAKGIWEYLEEWIKTPDISDGVGEFINFWKDKRIPNSLNNIALF